MQQHSVLLEVPLLLLILWKSTEQNHVDSIACKQSKNKLQQVKNCNKAFSKHPFCTCSSRKKKKQDPMVTLLRTRANTETSFGASTPGASAPSLMGW